MGRLWGGSPYDRPGLWRPQLHAVLSVADGDVWTHAAQPVCARLRPLPPGTALRSLSTSFWREQRRAGRHGHSVSMTHSFLLAFRVSTEGSLISWGSTFPAAWQCTPCSQAVKAASIKQRDTSAKGIKTGGKLVCQKTQRWAAWSIIVLFCGPLTVTVSLRSVNLYAVFAHTHPSPSMVAELCTRDQMSPT